MCTGGSAKDGRIEYKPFYFLALLHSAKIERFARKRRDRGAENRVVASAPIFFLSTQKKGVSIEHAIETGEKKFGVINQSIASH
jgi:hypothetical protein